MDFKREPSVRRNRRKEGRRGRREGRVRRIVLCESTRKHYLSSAEKTVKVKYTTRFTRAERERERERERQQKKWKSLLYTHTHTIVLATLPIEEERIKRSHS